MQNLINLLSNYEDDDDLFDAIEKFNQIINNYSGLGLDELQDILKLLSRGSLRPEIVDECVTRLEMFNSEYIIDGRDDN